MPDYIPCLFFASALLAAPSLYAAEPLSCRNALDTQLTNIPQASAGFTTDQNVGGVPLSDRSILLEAGKFEAQMGGDATASLTGGMSLRSGNKVAGADSARFNPEQGAMFLDGNVRYEDGGTQVTSDSADFSYESGRVEFTGAEFSLGYNARGAADNLLINQEGEIKLEGVSYTTCPPGSNDWELQAGNIDLDTQSGVGTARNIKLRFQNIPILYSPFISFPIGDARKSGLLTPEIGSSGRSGRELRMPFYWNIASNYDATITPRVLTDRGLQLQTEFRYLTAANKGTVTAQYLPDDRLVNKARNLLSLDHRTWFGNGWRNLLEFREVSDNQYFEDLGGSLSASSITHLDRKLSFDLHREHWSFFGQVQDYQTLDDAIIASDRPYQRLPQLLLSGYWPSQFMGLSLGLDSELVNFDRDVGVTGWRVNLRPLVELPIRGQGWFVNPGLVFDHTQYELSDGQPGFESDPSRSVPIASLDTGLVLERMTNASSGKRRIQTIEPRLLYVHVPHRNQDGLPLFDTITPDLNLVQLFRKNRFLGVDRIGDTDQVSVGVTSRILDVESGKELVTATVGQTRYLSDRQVALPGNFADNLGSTDYIAEVRVLLYQNLNFDFGHQWAPGDNGTQQSEARLQYRPDTNKILNLAYRFQRDAVEQGDLSWSWPLSSQWSFVGRYNFSFRDREVLEQFFGLEYESCCWGLRLVTRRHISSRDGTRDSSFGLQLVLKGMTSVGTAADKLLERGILGYSADLR